MSLALNNMKKILSLFLIFMLISIAACKQQSSEMEKKADAMEKTASTDAVDSVGNDISSVDNIENDLSSDQLNDLDSGFSDIESI